jgi:hypothetical protein
MKVVGLRVDLTFDHLPHDQRFEVGKGLGYLVNFQTEHGQAIGQLIQIPLVGGKIS